MTGRRKSLWVRLATVACAAVVVGVVAAPAAAHDDRRAKPVVSAAVEPSGDGSALLVRLTDADSGRPVSAARVV